LSKGAFDSAIPAAEAVRNEFQAKGDAVGSAHAVRVLLLAQLQKVIALEDDDVPVVTAESILTEAEKELDKSKSAGNSSAKAILQLAFTELLGFGTSRTGWSPDRPMRDKALDSANQAVDLFKEAGDTKMSAVAKLEISSLLCQGAAAKTALQAAQEAFDIFERLGDKQGMGRATWLMARSKLVAKDFDGALSKGHEALDLIRACGDKRAEDCSWSASCSGALLRASRTRHWSWRRRLLPFGLTWKHLRRRRLDLAFFSWKPWLASRRCAVVSRRRRSATIA